MTSSTNTTAASLLPAAVRARIYVGLSVANAMVLTAEAAYTLPKWVPILLAGVDALGFGLARRNTPT